MNDDNKIEDNILKFYDELKKDPYHRFRSWEHCYYYFQSGNIDIDVACLHLGFYLASWGMYRGSSFLLQKNYLIHKTTIEELIKPKYKPLRNAAFDIYQGNEGKENQELLFYLIENIKNKYPEIGRTINKDGEYELANVTDTLATKILLGTLACVPAYDRYFISGLRNTKDLTYSNLNISNFNKLINFCQNNLEYFQNTQNVMAKDNKKYPMMKLIDMYFWSIGNNV